jgi:hypothetical protein
LWGTARTGLAGARLAFFTGIWTSQLNKMVILFNWMAKAGQNAHVFAKDGGEISL